MAMTRNRQEESVVGEYSVRGDYMDQVTQSAVTPWTVTEDMTRPQFRIVPNIVEWR